MSGGAEEPKWLSLADVLAGHEMVMKEHGGQGGLIKPDELDSALARAKNLWLYRRASIFELASAYAKGITQNHPFNDGNKRASLMAAATFLRINGHKLRASQAEAVLMTEGLASGEVNEEGYGRWLKANAPKLEQHRERARSRAPKKKREQDLGM